MKRSERTNGLFPHEFTLTITEHPSLGWIVKSDVHPGFNHIIMPEEGLPEGLRRVPAALRQILVAQQDWNVTQQTKIRRDVVYPDLSRLPQNASGANDMRFGDRVIYTWNNKHGIVGAFLQDGDVCVEFDDGSCDTVKWRLLLPEAKE